MLQGAFYDDPGGPHTHQAFDLEALRGENEEQQETEALDGN